MRFLPFVLLASFSFAALAQTQSNPQLPKEANGSASSDPLAVGKSAFQRGDYTGARTFFANYVHDTPTEAEAWFYLGGTDLALEHSADAAKDFEKVVGLKPDAWGAHNNLALAYAESGNWVAFDTERALIKAARDRKAPGLSLEDHDIIDVLRVNGTVYQVWYFYKLHGKFNVRYVAINFDGHGKAKSWLQAESDDVDQFSFQKSHPREAKAGDRMFSLDSYVQSESGIPSQGLIKLYEGEPTYETFRADVLASLENRAKPQATVTSSGSKTNSSPR